MNGVRDVTVRVQDVERTFGCGDTETRVLRGLDLCASQGERIALYGPSGSGKTTLLNLIGALDRPDEGSIESIG